MPRHMDMSDEDLRVMDLSMLLERGDGLGMEITVERSGTGPVGCLIDERNVVLGVAEETPAHAAGVGAAVGRVLTHVNGTPCGDVASGDRLLRTATTQSVVLRFSPLIEYTTGNAGVGVRLRPSSAVTLPEGFVGAAGVGQGASSSPHRAHEPRLTPDPEVYQSPHHATPYVRPAAGAAATSPGVAARRASDGGSGTSPLSLHVCAQCRYDNARWRCPCHLVSYCSQTCQEKDWPNHIKACNADGAQKLGVSPMPRIYNASPARHSSPMRQRPHDDVFAAGAGAAAPPDNLAPSVPHQITSHKHPTFLRSVSGARVYHDA